MDGRRGSSAGRSPRESRSVRPAPARPGQADADPLIGQVVAGRYKILSPLGRGGMGVVYKVEHVHIGKLMAMKLLSGELARHAATVRRFRREAKAVSKLAHPNTVQIFDFGESARLAYLVMEYLSGRDFGSLIRENGPLPFTRVAKICAQVAASVAEAHDRGVIHRDIKPENVMVLDTALQNDFVKVLDFGIAQLREGEDLCGETLAGTVVGTPYYMAPEQIRAEPIDGRADVYALGAMMYKALTGAPPFVGNSPLAVLSKHLTEPVVPLNQRLPGAAIPEQAEAIVAKALQKDRHQRYAHMRELLEDLRKFLAQAGEPDPTPYDVEQGRESDYEASVREGALAKRDDVDRYEKRLRRTYLLAQVLGIGLVVSTAHAVYSLIGDTSFSPPSIEVEPNEQPRHATALLENRPLKGQLAKRLSSARGDEDVYRIDTPRGIKRVLDAWVTPLPNIDVVLELATKGQMQPLILVNGAGVGEGERIPNFALDGGSYYLRVRESPQAGRMPTENVSDWYSVGFRFVELGPADEAEPNNLLESTETLALGVARKGLLGWPGDRDMYCFRASAQPLAVEVSGAEAVDLKLRLLDRASSFTLEVNAAAGGRPELLEVPPSSAASPCVEVAANAAPAAAQMDAEHPYTLRLLEREPPLGPPPAPDSSPRHHR
jgi:serine/threonine protein kinase